MTDRRLDRALDDFLGDMARRNRKKRSQDDYFRHLCRMFVFLGRDPRVTDVTPELMRECLDTWAHTAPNTRYKVDAMFRAFCEWLCTQGHLDVNPMQRIPRPAKQHPDDLDVVTISEAGVMRMFEACETPRELLCLAVAAYAGSRRGAVARLRLGDVDFDNRLIRFQEKGGKAIVKPMPDELFDLIRAAQDAGVLGSDPSEYVVPGARPQRRQGERDDRVIYRIVKQVARRAGVEAHVHALRAAFAVKFLDQNPGRLFELSQLMGHRTIGTTQIYLRRKDRAEAMETVRTLSWGARFEDLPAKARTGFEPVYEALQASA